MKKLFFFATALLMSASMFAEGSVFTYTATMQLDTQFDKLGTVATHDFNDGNGKVTYSETVTTIGSMVFMNCTALQSVTLPEGVTTIGEYAFQWCESLQSVTFPASLTTIGESAFEKTGLTSVTIPAGVTEIGESAFYQCESLVSVTLPASVTTIGVNAFSNCSALQSITIPASVTTIGGFAFDKCSALASVTFLGNACQEGIGTNAFLNVGNTTPATLVLPANWTGTKPNAQGNWYGGKFKLNDTALPQMRAAVKATKRMVNGQLVIESKSLHYNAAGQEIR